VPRLVALAALAIGLALLLRRRRRRSASLPAGVETSLADELRERLAESRATEAEAREEPAAPVEGELDERRRDVHEAARRSLDELGT
jgi:hypothetical protein